MGKEKFVKFSISLPPDLYKILEEYSKSNNLERSRVIQLALRKFFEEVVGSSDFVYGFLVITYDNSFKDVEDMLTKLQHDNLDKIISSQHIHVTENICIETIAVRGKKEELVKIFSEISKVKGILSARFVVSWIKGTDKN
ncbi:MAG: CopG family ribbon-helix-helix protein [Sulfolobaceae archaeon]